MTHARPAHLAAPIAALTLLAAVPWAGAQSQTPTGLEPVEMIIEDRGPLRKSLRRLNQGMSPFGQETRMYRNQNADGRRLTLRQPGVWAEFDRSDYMRITKGKLKGMIFQEVPPNTVFRIGNPNPQPQPVEPRSRRLPGSISHQNIQLVDDRSVVHHQQPSDAWAQGTTHRQPATVGTGSAEQRILIPWQRYVDGRAAHRRALMLALDRLPTSDAPDPGPRPPAQPSP